MKRKLISVLLVLGMLFCMLPTAFAVDTGRSYEFDLSAAGSYELRATPGEIITLTLVLKRVDSADAAKMYAMQAEMLYDDSFFTLVEQSVITESDIHWEDLARRSGGRAFYLNYLSLGGGTEWQSETVIGSFQLKVTAESGTSAVRAENCIVSAQDGKDSFQTTAKNVTVVVSTDCTVTFEENGGSEVEDQIVRYGEKIVEPQPPVREGYVFNGWYRDLDCTSLWNFAEDTVAGNMTLYAGWLSEEDAAVGALLGEAPRGGFPWWIPVAFGGLMLVLLLLWLFGKKRIRFETDGGTELEAVSVKRKDLLERPMTPVKAGALFAGWYRDPECTIPWDFEHDRVEKSMTLYALWK